MLTSPYFWPALQRWNEQQPLPIPPNLSLMNCTTLALRMNHVDDREIKEDSVLKSKATLCLQLQVHEWREKVRPTSSASVVPSAVSYPCIPVPCNHTKKRPSCQEGSQLHYLITWLIITPVICLPLLKFHIFTIKTGITLVSIIQLNKLYIINHFLNCNMFYDFSNYQTIKCILNTPSNSK